MKGKPKLDLAYYLGHFEDACHERYGKTFTEEFRAIADTYKDVRAGKDRLNVGHVTAIFSKDLPFVQDWTKPDAQSLEERMKEHGVADAVSRLRDRSDPAGVLELISEIREGFGDLSLTALVLHHVYPARFAMCSHHLASLLYIVDGSTVPKFYIEYCEELKLWGKEVSTRQLNAVETEFALWTWYRLTYYGRNEEKRKNRDNFFKDPWVQERRAIKIAGALKELGRLDVARSYLGIDANLAAIIAWVEFECAVRKVLQAAKVNTPKTNGMKELIRKLPIEALPGGREELERLWFRYEHGEKRGRNEVIHTGLQLKQSEAGDIVAGVFEFLTHNF